MISLQKEKNGRWFALVGPDINKGEAGFGTSPFAAVMDLCQRMTTNLFRLAYEETLKDEKNNREHAANE